jgi:secondary thiamine-phosphate synthase enzyme
MDAGRTRRIALLAILVVLSITLLYTYRAQSPSAEEVSYSTALQEIRAGEVQRITVTGDRATLELREARRNQTTQLPARDELFYNTIDEFNTANPSRRIEVRIEQQSATLGLLGSILLSLLPVLLIGGLLTLLLFRMRAASGAGGPPLQSWGPMAARRMEPAPERRAGLAGGRRAILQRRIQVRSTNEEEVLAITDEVQSAVADSRVRNGICLVAVEHTTCGVFVNENADPDVQRDLLLALRKLVPEDPEFTHGEGNSPAHIKAVLVGSSAAIPIASGELVLGRWQGIYIADFDGPRARHATLTIVGEAAG